jgi:hypothetical protein
LESAELVEELEVELGFVEEEPEVGVPLVEEVKVTPCTGSDGGQWKMGGISAHHSATHRLSCLKGLLQVTTGTAALEARRRRLDERLVFAQASGVGRGTSGDATGGGGQTGEGTSCDKIKRN